VLIAIAAAVLLAVGLDLAHVFDSNEPASAAPSPSETFSPNPPSPIVDPEPVVETSQVDEAVDYLRTQMYVEKWCNTIIDPYITLAQAKRLWLDALEQKADPNTNGEAWQIAARDYHVGMTELYDAAFERFC
jgi:hypothetical protein